jgi:predicted deacylase
MLKIQEVQAEAGKIVYGRLMVDSVQIPLILAAGEQDGPVVVFHCAQHRTEYGGSTAVPRLLRNLDLSQLHGTIVAMPLVDVPAIVTTRLKDAYPEQSRDMQKYAHEERANINRVWPGSATGSWVDRLAWAISEEVFKKASAVVDFHAARVVDYPFAGYSAEHGPSKELALAFGLRVVDETSTSWHPVGQLHKAIPLNYNVASILVEAPSSSGVVAEPIAQLMYRGMLNVCKHYKMLPGEPELDPEQIVFRRPDPTHVFTSQHVGFFTWYKGYGQLVKKGELIGEVRDVSTFQVLQQCIAPFDGGLPSVGPGISQVVLPGEELATLKPVIEVRKNR